MKTAPRRRATPPPQAGRRVQRPRRPKAKAVELKDLRARLAEAETTLRAIRTGEVDTVVIAGRKGPQVFTLQGDEHPYRDLIETMNEGALTLTTDKAILYANACFARLVKCPLEQVIGGSLRRFLSPESAGLLRALLKKAAKTGAKFQTTLIASDDSRVPVQVSLRPMAPRPGQHATIGLVVTDLTEAHRTEELMQALTHRVVQVQEAERASVALELHDHITQPLCAALFSSQVLADTLTSQTQVARDEALRLRELLGATAAEVERISRHLRPGVLNQLGLAAVLRTTGTEFTARTGVPVQLTGDLLTAFLPAETELALYRILQEALKNVERHARARHVTVNLQQRATELLLAITDDGIGFDAEDHATRLKGKGVLGLLAMRERAAYVGGALTVKSGPRAGTEITVRIPRTPILPAAA